MSLDVRRTPILISHAYLRKEKHLGKYFTALTPHVDVLIDSGAYTDYHAAKKAKGAGQTYAPITVEEYIDACQRYVAQKAFGYIALDVIMDRAATLKNLEAMVKAGLKPIPVQTVDMPPTAVNDLRGIHDYICLAAGGLTDSQFCARVRAISGAATGPIRLHTLGFARWRRIFALPLFSCDVSTYGNGAQWGQATMFHPGEGMVSLYASQLRNFTKRLAKGNDRLAHKILGHMLRCNVAREELADETMWRGHWGMCAWITLHAYLRFQTYAASRGVKLFFAITNSDWLQNMAIAVQYADLPAIDVKACIRDAQALNLLRKKDRQEHAEALARIFAGRLGRAA